MNTADSPLLKPQTPFERRVVQSVAAAKPNASVGILEKPLPGGRSLTPLRYRPRQPVDIHPFYIKASGLIHVGLVNSSLIPVYDNDPIGPEGTPLDFNAHGGDFLVYLKAEVTVIFGPHHFLTNWDFIAEDPLEIVVSPTALTDSIDLDAGSLISYRWIAQIAGRRVQREQQTRTNLFFSVCDASNGNSDGKDLTATWTAEAA